MQEVRLTQVHLQVEKIVTTQDEADEEGVKNPPKVSQPEHNQCGQCN